MQGSRIGNATESTEVTKSPDGDLVLRSESCDNSRVEKLISTSSLNPGRIEPDHLAWEETRKPLAAQWQTTAGDRFFTVNVHFSSKRDSSSTHGDARPPVNGHGARRALQANVTAVRVQLIPVLYVSHAVILPDRISLTAYSLSMLTQASWSPET